MPKMTAVVAASIAVLFLFVGADAQSRHHRTSRPRATGAVRTASGLTYLVTEKGTGRKPKKGETVVVHYTGTLTSGLKFDSSLDRGEPISFPLGAGRVIKGWDEGIAKLHIGDKAILVIPAKLGYGEKGAGGVIPPNAKLIFIVQLVDIQGPPLADMLLNVYKTGGVTAMLTRYREVKLGGFKDVSHSESDLNGLGYELLRQKKLADAIDVFKLVVEEYPKSANVYDSLGEAYVAAGQKQLAIETYEKALMIDPKYPSAIKALEKLKAQ